VTIRTSSAALAALFLLAANPASAQSDWAYGGNAEGTRYSPLKQINRSNVSRLKVAWTYDVTAAGGRGSGMQTQTLVVNGVVYGNTQGGQVIALDCATGKLIWSWDPKAGGQRIRGYTFWSEGTDRRIFAGVGRYVYALSARTGEPIDTFGAKGRIDLHQDLGRDPEKQ